MYIESMNLCQMPVTLILGSREIRFHDHDLESLFQN